MIILTFFGLFSVITIYASQPPPSQRIKASVVEALKSFGIDPESVQIIKTDTPTSDSQNWDTESSTIYINGHLAHHSNLLTFTAYCAAAHLENNSSIKNTAADLATTFVPAIMLSTATAFTSENPGMGAIVGCAFSWLLSKKVGTNRKIKDYYYKQAYADACQKLIDDNNMPVIAAYAAYSELIKHNPLDRITRVNAIKKTLEDAGYTLDIEGKSDLPSVLIKKKETDILVAKSSIEFIDRERQSFKFIN